MKPMAAVWDEICKMSPWRFVPRCACFFFIVCFKSGTGKTLVESFLHDVRSRDDGWVTRMNSEVKDQWFSKFWHRFRVISHLNST